MKLSLQSLVPSLVRPEQELSNWEFKPLKDIEVLGTDRYTQARILYEDDASGDLHAVLCCASDFNHLDPYAAELLAWKQDPLGFEQPVIPIAHTNTGSPRFCPEGPCLTNPSHSAVR